MSVSEIIGFLSIAMFGLSLLSVGVIYSKLHWIIKSMLMISSLGVIVGLYFILITSLGWPIATIPSGKVRFLWAETQEPNKSTNDPGVIYLWYMPENVTIPRSVRLPFSKQTQEAMETAKANTEKGLDTFLQNAKEVIEAVAEGDTQGQGDNGGNGSSKASTEESQGFGYGDSHGGYASDMKIVPPPRTLPKKNH